MIPFHKYLFLPFPKKKYNIIYADPPYSFNSPKFQDGNRGFGNRVEDRYKTMSIKDICNLPVKNITCDNIIPRKPLSKHAKRAGWQGCNLHFTNIHFITPAF